MSLAESASSPAERPARLADKFDPTRLLKVQGVDGVEFEVPAQAALMSKTVEAVVQLEQEHMEDEGHVVMLTKGTKEQLEQVGLDPG